MLLTHAGSVGALLVECAVGVGGAGANADALLAAVAAAAVQAALARHRDPDALHLWRARVARRARALLLVAHHLTGGIQATGRVRAARVGALATSARLGERALVVGGARRAAKAGVAYGVARTVLVVGALHRNCGQDE